MYTNFMIIRTVYITDYVTIGSGNLLLGDADMAGGVYCGKPVQLVK